MAPIILCPAGALPQRIPAEWRPALADGRLLILSAFADEVCFAYITPGGQSERLTRRLAEWGVPFSVLKEG